MARTSKFTVASAILILGLMTCTQIHLALGQLANVQEQRPARIATPPQPVSLAHLYWHFLVYQDHLDNKSLDLITHGKDGSKMHGYLQHQLGWSDSDFAPIRASSSRLSAKIKSLDSQAMAVIGGGPSPAASAQLQALTAEREEDINTEVTYLRQTLSPAQVKAFESFLTQFFSPANATTPPAPPSRASLTAVQQ